VEHRAQWGQVQDPYLDPAKVQRMFDPFCPSCGAALPGATPCEACQRPARVLHQQDRGAFLWSYRAHADVGEGRSNFSVVIAHAEAFTGPDGQSWPHVVVDHIKIWSARDYATRELPYDEIEDELTELICRFPPLEVLSFDQYGSLLSTSRMRTRLRERRHGARVVKVDFTEGSNQERAMRFKAAVNMGLVHAYRDPFGPEGSSRLEVELKLLELRNGKVIKPSYGVIRSKDAADAIMEVSSQLLRDRLDRAGTRDRLSSTRLLSGAPGGYHSGQVERPAVDRSGARERLRRIAREGTRRRWPRG
jgi:hypothetical protein